MHMPMPYSNNIDEQIKRIKAWAIRNKGFDLTFVNSVADQYEERHCLSERQERALKTIIQRWRIPELRRPQHVKARKHGDDDDCSSDDCSGDDCGDVLDDEDDSDSDVECVTGVPRPPTICPLTQMLFQEPVQNTRCGHIYSKAAIHSHLTIMHVDACQCPVAGCAHMIHRSKLKPFIAQEITEMVTVNQRECIDCS
jgi:hypothetical protein